MNSHCEMLYFVMNMDMHCRLVLRRTLDLRRIPWDQKMDKDLEM